MVASEEIFKSSTEVEMLILSRKENETIRINDDVIVSVVAIRGDKVRIGFDAPKSVVIHRGEIYEAIQRTTQEEDASVKFPNLDIAQKMREYADAIEGLNFPVNLHLETFFLKPIQVEQFKVAFAEADFESNSYKGESWLKAIPIDRRVSITAYSPRQNAVEVPA
jgi:carbon storage regulator